MKKIFFFYLIGFFILNKASLKITSEQAQIIGKKIWHNECNGTINGLTSWNNGENFASLGIGHFIWYPAHSKRYYAQTFPTLLTFLENHGKPLPAGILKNGNRHCPWQNQQEFLAAFESASMQALRNYLVETIDLQILYIMQRLQSSLTRMLKVTAEKKKNHLKKQFNRITQTPNGIYALVDYINFKGEGITKQDDYNGIRWGLLQVLENMTDNNNALQAFVASAKKVLANRVANAPEGKNESRWIPGWNKRLDTYLEDLNK